ncbi:MAG: hypothetical protein JSW06_06845 [Thermoplasmatales archaeon]|nr:MAG: hypothetical protein JSW06_06845 [Thermoplasmatales archaeon]
MRVIGLLSSEEEANEIKFIAKICTINTRIRFIVHLDKLKKMVEEKR